MTEGELRNQSRRERKKMKKRRNYGRIIEGELCNQRRKKQFRKLVHGLGQHILPY